MDPKSLIETYVADVIRRLPRRMRNDVGFELRALLGEELDGMAQEAGRQADEAMALALLGAFGHPADVADRYRPADFVIIRASETRGFALASILGVLAQWALSLPRFLGQAGHDPLAHIGQWWVSWGLGALWFPGFLVMVALAARAVGQRWPRTRVWAPPAKAVDRDRISRPWLALGLAFWAAGAGFWIALAWLAPRLPGVLPQVLAFDGEFLRTRAPWLLPLWAGSFAVYGVAWAEGRWREATRRIEAGLSAAIAGLMAWFVIAGPMFTSKPTDDFARLALVILIGTIVGGAAFRLLRGRGKLQPPRATEA